MVGTVDLVGTMDQELTTDEANECLNDRSSYSGLRDDPDLPDDTRLWAALQAVGGGTWSGCVYDVEAIVESLKAAKNSQKSE